MLFFRRPRALFGIAMGIIARPHLWPVTYRVMIRLAPQRWWARAPFLPLPSMEYARFRMQTQYGDASSTPTLADVLTYLQWVRHWDTTS